MFVLNAQNQQDLIILAVDLYFSCADYHREEMSENTDIDDYFINRDTEQNNF